MCDYLNGIIYKLVCEITGETYIGSTKRSLEDRLKDHLNKGNKSCCKQIINRNKYYIEQLESYPCNNRQELVQREGEYQRVFECININIAGRTNANYRQDNKEYLKEYNKQHYQDNKEYYKEYSKQYSKQYRLDNKEMINSKAHAEINCECGIKIRYDNLAKHKRTKKHKTLMSNLNQPSSDPLVLEMPVQNQAGRISSH